MDIKEINDISTNNLSTKSLNVTNLERSDELSVSESNSSIGGTEYSKKKRKKWIKRVGQITVISVSIVAGGASIKSSLFGKNPKINNQNPIVVNGITLTYKYDLTIDNLGLILEIDNGKEKVYTLEMKKTGIYEGTVLLSSKTKYYVNHFYTNFADYKIKANDISYSFITE